MRVGSSHDPLEHQAVRSVQRHPGGSDLSTPDRGGLGVDPTAGNTWAGHSGTSPVPAGVASGLLRMRGGGQPLLPDERSTFGRQFGHDFSRVRVHAGDQAAQVTAGLHARALTLGEDIVLSPVAVALGTSGRNRLLAHELTHVVQQRHAAGQPWIQRQPLDTPSTLVSPPALKAGDDVEVEVYALSTDAEPDRSYSGRFRVDAQRLLVLGPGGASASVPVGDLSPGVAAQTIADHLVTAELFRGPRVCVKGPRMAAPACANAKTAMPPEVARAYAAFKAYIATTKTPVDAVARYHQWVSDHLTQPDFTTVSPWDLWAKSLKPPAGPVDPQAERTDVWLRFMAARNAENATLTGRERLVAAEALRAFQDWYSTHRDKPEFAQADPAKIYARLWVAQLRPHIEADTRAKVAAEHEAAARSPAAMAAIDAKLGEFIATARKLWGTPHKHPLANPVRTLPRPNHLAVTGPSMWEVSRSRLVEAEP